MSGVKILIVEDADVLQVFFERILGSKASVLQARDVVEAERLFATHRDIKAIAMDDCLIPGGRQLTTLPLARKFRRRFTGPMIAMTTNPLSRMKLMDAGCDFGIEDKHDLPHTLSRVLNI